MSRSRSDRAAAWFFCALAGASADCTSADAARNSQPYPSRPVRLIIPFPPAGGTDIVGRVVGQKLNEKLGQPFIIDNRGGAAGTLGAGIAAKAPADGYTIMLATASFAISANFYMQLPYDSVRDFAAVARIASGPLLFVLHPSVPARSIRELIVLAKANPGKLNYASGGEGGINHLPAEMFNHMAGVRLVHIPYKGAGPALAALLGGEVQLMIATLGSCLPHVRSGKLRDLAIAGERRSSLAPQVPTVAEAGVPGYAADSWYGLVAPRGTPPEIVNLLNREITAALDREEVRAQFVALGFEPASSTPAQFADYLKSEIVKWGRVVKESGISAEVAR